VAAIQIAPVVQPVLEKLSTICSTAAIIPGAEVVAGGCAIGAGGLANLAEEINTASGCESTFDLVRDLALQVPGQALDFADLERISHLVDASTGAYGLATSEPLPCSCGG
jgi:hypothetical protein